MTLGVRKRMQHTYTGLRIQSAADNVAEDKSAARGETPISDLQLVSCENGQL